MSVRVMADVFAHSEATGNDRLVLLAIADEADDQGENAYPGVALLATKVRLPKRTVLRCIDRLVTLGELEKHRPENQGRGQFTRYVVHLEKGTKVSPLGGQKGARRVPEGCQKGDTSPPLTSGNANTLDPNPGPNLFAAEQTRPPRKPRPPDPTWDAMVDSCGLSGASPTPRERDAWNGAAKQLRMVQATPEEISGRAAEHRRRWPNASLTPTSLARHWAELDVQQGNGERGMTEAEYLAQKASPSWL